MELLNYITRGKHSVSGRVKVLFCCHPEDFEKYFHTITKKIHQYVDCAIYYRECLEEDIFACLQEYEALLSEMRLLVIPVTQKLLENIGRTVSIELEYAKEHCIPVLPIVEETVSEEDYREVFGTIQYLYEQACDVTTLSFEEKLEKYLHSVLVSNEVMMQIKEEFEGQIFLSYRKKDRQYAQELMKLIHSVDFTRDLSIWYDENIKLGERFDEEIMEAIVKSQLFALCVTPNLVKEPNYVLSTELPKAFEMEMPVVAVEMQKTDYNLLPEFRPDDCYVMERDMKHLEAAITKSFSYLKSKERNNEPEHLYLMGLAYLNGIGVEFDSDTALFLLNEASQCGYYLATKRLIHVYTYGEGVPINLQKAFEFSMELVHKLNVELETTKSPETKRELFDTILSTLQLLDEHDLSCIPNYFSMICDLTLLSLSVASEDIEIELYYVFLMFAFLAFLNRNEDEVFNCMVQSLENIFKDHESIFQEKDEYLAGEAYVLGKLAAIYTEKHTGMLAFELGDRREYHEMVASRRKEYLEKSLEIQEYLYEKDPVKWKGSYADALVFVCKSDEQLMFCNNRYCEMMEKALAIYRELISDGRNHYKENLVQACLKYSFDLHVEIDDYIWEPDRLAILSDYEENAIPENPLNRLPSSVEFCDETYDGEPDIRRLKKVTALQYYAINILENEIAQGAKYLLDDLASGYTGLIETLNYAHHLLGELDFFELKKAVSEEFAAKFCRFIDVVLEQIEYTYGKFPQQSKPISDNSFEAANQTDENDVLKKEKKLLELESEAYSVNPFVMGYNFALELNDVGMKKEAEQMHASLFTFLDQAYSRMDQNLVLLNVLAYSSIIDDKEQSRNILLRYLSYYDYSKLEIENYYFKMNHVEYLKDYYCLLRKLDVDSEIYLQCDSFLQWSENIVYNEYAEFFYLRADCKKRLSKISEAKVYYERAMEYAFDEIDDDKEQFCDILRDYVSLLREEGCVEEAEYWIEMLDGV